MRSYLASLLARVLQPDRIVRPRPVALFGQPIAGPEWRLRDAVPVPVAPAEQEFTPPAHARPAREHESETRSMLQQEPSPDAAERATPALLRSARQGRTAAGPVAKEVAPPPAREQPPHAEAPRHIEASGRPRSEQHAMTVISVSEQPSNAEDHWHVEPTGHPPADLPASVATGAVRQDPGAERSRQIESSALVRNGKHEGADSERRTSSRRSDRSGEQSEHKFFGLTDVSPLETVQSDAAPGDAPGASGQAVVRSIVTVAEHGADRARTHDTPPARFEARQSNAEPMLDRDQGRSPSAAPRSALHAAPGKPVVGKQPRQPAAPASERAATREADSIRAPIAPTASIAPRFAAVRGMLDLPRLGQNGRAASRDPAEPSTVHVTIGTLEVRANTVASQPRPRPSSVKAPRLGLEEYLRLRRNGGRG